MLGIDAKSVADEAKKEIAEEASKAAKDRLKAKYLSLEKARQVVRNIEREIDAELKSIEENSIYEAAVSMFEDRNRFYRLFHGAPIPVEWQGWQSNTHALHRQGWEITAEEGRDDYSMCHRVRLGLLSPEKTMMIHGLMSVPHTSMYGGSMEEIEMMHRIGFRDMGVIHQRDVHRVMPEREFMQIDSLRPIDPYTPADASIIDVRGGRFKFLNYVEGDPKSIIVLPMWRSV